MTTSNIHQVLAELHSITQRAHQKASPIGYFSALYARMTTAMERRVNAGFFDDASRMERYTIAFARLYIDEVERRWKGTPVGSTAWRVALDACEDKKTIILQHIYLGLTAHLLRDLALAAAETCPGDAVFAFRSDYLKIEDVVLSEMDAFHADLAKVSPTLDTLRQRAGKWWETLSISTLHAARAIAWQGAYRLARSQSGTDYIIRQLVDRSAAQVGKLILSPGPAAALVVRSIRKQENHDVRHVIGVLTGTTA